MKTLLVGLSLILAAAPSSGKICDTTPASFAGEVIGSGFAPGTVRLEWKVLEDAAVREYRLSRREAGCAHPSRCDAVVATVRARGPIGTAVVYELVDTAPAGVWTYRLEVVRKRGASCALETGEIFAPATQACDLATLCSHAENSFAAGDPGTGLADLRWTTSGEGGSIEGYRLSRYDCGAAADCWAEVATVGASGDCGVPQVRGLTATGGAPAYRLELFDGAGRVVCTVDRAVR